MIAWEDRDEAGRAALLAYIGARPGAIRAHWAEIALAVAAGLWAARDWAAIARTVLSWL